MCNFGTGPGAEDHTIFLNCSLRVFWLVFWPIAPHHCSLDLAWSPLAGPAASTFRIALRNKILRLPLPPRLNASLRTMTVLIYSTEVAGQKSQPFGLLPIKTTTKTAAMMDQWGHVHRIWMRQERQAEELPDANPGCQSSTQMTHIVWHEQLWWAYRTVDVVSNINQMCTFVFGARRSGAMREGHWQKNCSHWPVASWICPCMVCRMHNVSSGG